MTKLLPPDEVRGMKILNRDKFRKVFEIPTLKISNENLSSTIKLLKKFLLKVDNFKPVQPFDSDPNSGKIAFLNPSLVLNWADLDKSIVEALSRLDVTQDSFQRKSIALDYTNWKSDEIFNAILPLENNQLSGYSIIGHIIHLNLRDHNLEYKNLIGEVLLDKVKNCKTVVNKMNQIDNTYRNFSFELLHGEDNFITCTKENGCKFEFDFSKVYWNPRLSTEHERIANKLKKKDVLFDVFCGVGPFAIPAGKKQCTVFANDLNPDSFQWLTHNIRLNRIKPNTIKTFNIDGRIFIKKIFYNFITEEHSSFELQQDSTVHLTMNLPALALTFLDTFVNLCRHADQNLICKLQMIVHVYFFMPTEDPKEAAKMVNDSIGLDVSDQILEIVHVRSVAPKKEMMRVSFVLLRNILFDASNLYEKRKCTFTDEVPPISKIPKT